MSKTIGGLRLETRGGLRDEVRGGRRRLRLSLRGEEDVGGYRLDKVGGRRL
jgi:hypothetical protein